MDLYYDPFKYKICMFFSVEINIRLECEVLACIYRFHCISLKVKLKTDNATKKRTLFAGNFHPISGGPKLAPSEVSTMPKRTGAGNESPGVGQRSVLAPAAPHISQTPSAGRRDIDTYCY